MGFWKLCIHQCLHIFFCLHVMGQWHKIAFNGLANKIGKHYKIVSMRIFNSGINAEQKIKLENNVEGEEVL